MPRQPERPKQSDGLAQLLRAGKDQICAPEHLEEHQQKKAQKPVAERLAFHPPGNIGPPGEAEASTQQAEQLSPSTRAVAVALIPARKGDDQRDEKAEEAQPGKEDVEEAQHQIEERGDPEEVIPALFHGRFSSSVIMVAGHSAAHLPQPTHRSASTRAVIPFQIRMAERGQTRTQQPQATQSAPIFAVLRWCFRKSIGNPLTEMRPV